MPKTAYCGGLACQSRRSTKLLLVMKLTVLLLTTAFLNVSANGLSQTVTFAGKQVSLEKVFTVVEQQTGYVFLYTKDMLKDAGTVTLNVHDQPLAQFLETLFANRPIGYKLSVKSILLSRRVPPITVLEQPKPFAEIKGVVRDKDGHPLAGANVVLNNSNTGVNTQSDGSFSINANTGDVLTISSVGYTTITVKITSATQPLTITLERATTKLDEIEVIAYGYGTQKKGNITGAIAKIGEKQIQDRPITRIEQALQGQVAGVAVRNTTGAPGADITVQVRGAASISGTATPLYVVDGVPLDNLSGINPSDIASIDVLKDASSAAIYGSRGSNGVIIITTKRGKPGKPTLSLNAYTAVAQAERKVDVLTSDEWIDFNKKWLDHVWTTATGLPATATQAERIAYAQSKTGKTYTTRTDLMGIRTTYGIYDPFWGTDALDPIDWQNVVLRKAPVNNLELRASGATDAVNYSVSGGVYDQNGIIVGSNYRRYSFRGNMEAKVSDRVKIGLNISPSVGTITGANVDGKDNAVSRMLSLPGWVLAGTGKQAGAQPSKYYDGWGPGPNIISPYVQAADYDRINKDLRLNTAFSTEVNIINGLDVRGLVGWNYRTNSERTYNPTWAQATWDQATPGQLSTSKKTTIISNSLLLQATATYRKQIGLHGINLLFGASQETFNADSTNQQATGFPDDKTYIFDLSRAKTINANSINSAKNALISYFGRAEYNFDNKYLLAGSLRRDGSSKFGPSNRWGIFPSLSAGWIMSQEAFLNNFNWLSMAKLRAAWGQAGNDRIGNSAFLSGMAILNYPTGTSQTSTNGYVVGNISNSKLRWEKTNSYNLGLDIGFFNNRITMSADVYYKKTTDLLLNAPVSLTTGFTNMYDNVGSVDNKGFELEINTANIAQKNFRWNTAVNVSLNRNKITSLTNDNADIKLGQGNTIIQRVGSPINSYYLLRTAGVLRESDFSKDASGNLIANVPIYSGQKPGDTKYIDSKPDGKIDADDYVVAGSFQPKFEYGITNTFSYRNWDLSILIQGRVGGKLLSIGSRAWNRATNDPRYNYMASWLKDAYWSEAEPGNGKVPAFFSAVTSQYDDNWMYSAAYLRIKNVTLGYNMQVLKKAFRSIRVYASCDNVWLFDKYYPGYSPEGATQDNASADWGSYPQARTFAFGLTATF
ncbi:SusC/RagA family TonB-linked outer membrane protein [Niastella koreensis]|uniref:TonB-dependent receptor plug n=3 Tax=Niastella koreensis TaxID=354356 RepID=G8TBR1_NIAKG|nr:TonB-dependent receptor plug [Niastella koreensis GR20-10]OQP44302.1 SusC/RagA family TonB-linked outer membrane protein [Niastella koreensis]